MTQNPSYDTLSNISLDATEVRRIREQQKLTQLYVSKVVGVTTDTISRWENNRYPSIRRENALRLAEALNVALEDIVQKSMEEAVEPSSGVSRQRLMIMLFGIGLFCLACLAVLYVLLTDQPAPLTEVTARRLLPNYAAPGGTIPVQIALTYRTEEGGVILKEYFPKGWKIVQADPPASSLDNVNGVARWIIKGGDERRKRVVYLLDVAAAPGAGEVASFTGEIVSGSEKNQSSVSVQGEGTISLAPVHWADADADGTIDDGEMLQASFTLEDMAGVYVDWDALEALWDAGRYSWNNQEKKFLPQLNQP